MLRHLIWGFKVRMGSSAYTSAENLNCPHVRLFWKMPAQSPLDKVPLLLRETRRVLYLKDHASVSRCRDQKAGEKVGGLESIAPSLEPCCSTIRRFSSVKSHIRICFLDLQRGRHLSEVEVGEKCSEKRNPQPAPISCENMEECGEASLGNIS